MVYALRQQPNRTLAPLAACCAALSILGGSLEICQTTTTVQLYTVTAVSDRHG